MSQQSPCLANPADEIHVWSAALDPEPQSEEGWYALLSPAERDRAGRFRFPIHRKRFTASRGILRILLGRYLNVAPELLSFAYGAHGKPAVLNGSLHFNVSHSEGQALFAFSSTSPLGVDLERIRPLRDVLTLAASVFSPDEVRAFEALAPEHRDAAFFKGWTRKEAVIKALGSGLSYPLREWSVSLDEPARLVQVNEGHAELMQWQLYHLEPTPNYLGAIATRQRDSRIVLRHFDAPSPA